MSAQDAMQEPPSEPASAPSPACTRRRHHIEMLVIALAVALASFVLDVGDGGGVQVVSSRLKLPPLCASKALFNVECPGCGLTRGFVHLAHGRVQESLAVNRVAWLVALAMLVSIPYRVAAIYRKEPHPLGLWVPRLFGFALIAALVGNWLLKQCGV